DSGYPAYAGGNPESSGSRAIALSVVEQALTEHAKTCVEIRLSEAHRRRWIGKQGLGFHEQLDVAFRPLPQPLRANSGLSRKLEDQRHNDGMPRHPVLAPCVMRVTYDRRFCEPDGTHFGEVLQD